MYITEQVSLCVRAMEDRKLCMVAAEEERRRKILNERKLFQQLATKRFRQVTEKLKTIESSTRSPPSENIHKNIESNTRSAPSENIHKSIETLGVHPVRIYIEYREQHQECTQ